MIADSMESTVRSLNGMNLRPPAATFEAIDASRSAWSDSVSRNTWITETVEEKLARDRLGRAHGEGGEHA
jgi:hypothetical protein